MQELTIPGGQEKGRTVSTASDNCLKWWAQNAKQDNLKQACAAELQRRQNGGAPAQSPQRNAPSAPPTGRELVTGAFRDPQKATEALRDAQERAHLVAPATVCATLPEGTEIALAAVFVSELTETYKLPGGKFGLGKTALDRIAAAAGVDWDPHLCGRLDDGYDPHYCHYRAVGYVRTFDGSIRTITGAVEIDARDGSPQIEEIITKATTKGRWDGDDWQPRDPKPQILELRKFLLRHAESKAKNRAIRSLGLQTSYTSEELQKPFVVAKPMFTGYSDDPEAKREFRTAIADSYLGARGRLYGGGATPEPQRQMPQQAQRTAGHRPPPVGSVPIDADYSNVSPRGAYPGEQDQGQQTFTGMDGDGPGTVAEGEYGDQDASDIPY